jgi:putative ABC transport system substrate-binding protein
VTTVEAVRRRDFLRGSVVVAGVGLLAGCGIPFGPWAQPARIPRIGFLALGSETSNAPNSAAFRQGLRELGYIEGQHFGLEQRYADGREERLPELAADLARLEIDVIVTGSPVAIRAAQQATTTIPTVFAATGGDPVAEGVVASLARPGGNITGLTLSAGEEQGKRLELLKGALPGMSRVAVLWNQNAVSISSELEMAARSLSVQLVPLELRSPDEIDTVVAGAITAGADGLIVAQGAEFVVLAPRIVELASQHRLPAMYSSSQFINAGGLMIYAANITDNFRRAATYVDKILKGANPGDLPIERPVKYEFTINLKTAQALGRTMPQSLLAQATEVIQ